MSPVGLYGIDRRRAKYRRLKQREELLIQKYNLSPEDAKKVAQELEDFAREEKRGQNIR